MDPQQSVELVHRYVSKFDESEIKGRHVTLVLGSTGAGKSTFFNFICGCTMKRAKKDQDDYGLVIEVAEDSPIPAKVRIGHGSKSRTSMPFIVEADGVLYCDFPGFFDNSGFERDISNAIVLSKLCRLTRGVNIILLAERNSLKVQRAALAYSLNSVFDQVFGQNRDFKAYSESVMVGVTKVPDDYTMNNLKYDLQQTSTSLRCFPRLFLFKPLEENSRTLIRKEIAKLPYIENESSRVLFSPYLSDSTRAEVIKLCTESNEQIRLNIASTNFEDVHRFLSTLLNFEQLGIEEVTKIAAKEKGHIELMLLAKCNNLIHIHSLKGDFNSAKQICLLLENFKKNFFPHIDIASIDYAIKKAEDLLRKSRWP